MQTQSSQTETSRAMAILFVVIVIAVADQFSKQLVCSFFRVERGITIIPHLFDLRYVRNTGAAWGMFGNLNGWLVVFSAAVLACIFLFRRKIMHTGSPAHAIAFAFMIGGIVGNLLDRLRFGYVVDFLDFHWHGHCFPTFNIADSSICLGVGLYMILSFRSA